MAGLDELLVSRAVIDEAQRNEALQYAQTNGVRFPRAVTALGFASEEQIMETVADSLSMPFVNLETQLVDPATEDLVSHGEMSEAQMFPYGFTDDGSRLLVAIADLSKRNEQAAFEQTIGQPVELALTTRRMLTRAIQRSSPDRQIAKADGPANPLTLADSAHRPLGQVEEQELKVDLDQLLGVLLERGGSDLHLTAGISPAIRVNGELTQMKEFPKLLPDDLQSILYAIMTQKQREEFENNLELDMSYSLPGKARFRVNIFQQRDSVGSVMRTIPFEIMPLERLGIPEQVSKFAYVPRGFVLVTGPTGSGKSTTLASIIDLINRNRATHIMTVEDPIEFLHNHKKSVVNQREVGSDTHGFAPALKHVLRQDPDVILVGELRDLETIQIALTAAETGHLVFGTLHTQDAPQTVDRIVDVFPPHQQEQIRVMLAGALKGVVCQTLLKTADGTGRVAAVEILVATSGIKNLIREGKTHQIYSAIQAGARDGMVAMDQSLANLVSEGRVTYEDALEKCSNEAEFRRLSGRG